jgi:hypothetical protein
LWLRTLKKEKYEEKLLEVEEDGDELEGRGRRGRRRTEEKRKNGKICVNRLTFFLCCLYNCSDRTMDFHLTTWN